MVIVFAVLILLQYIIEAIHLFANRAKKENDVQSQPATAAAVQTPLEPDSAELEEPCDEELIAVIAAAISSSLDVSTYDLRIKSVKRVPPYSPAWNRAGRIEQVNNKI